MNYQPTTRRSFLTNMAVLSAGAVLLPVTNLFGTERPRTDLKQHWDDFCRENGARPFPENIDTEEAQISVCQGHFQQTGKPVCFPGENLLAQPTWIYWDKAMKKPNDIVISFFDKEGNKKKLFRINRFELESMNGLKSDDASKSCLSSLKEGRRFQNMGKKPAEGLQIKTRVTGKTARTVLTLSKDQNLIQNNFIHHI